MVTENIDRRLTSLEEVKKKFSIGPFRTPKVNSNNEIILKVAGFWARLPILIELILILPILLIGILCSLVVYFIKSEEIAAVMCTLLIIPGLYFFYQYRSKKLKKYYNLDSDGVVRLTKSSIYIPSIYTGTDSGCELSLKEIKNIDFTWNYTRNKLSPTSSASVDLMDVHVISKQGQHFILPVWITKTHDLLYALLTFNYPVYLVRIDRQLLKSIYNGLFYIVLGMLLLGTSYSGYLLVTDRF